MLFTPAQIKPKSFASRRTFFILPGVDASHVYVRAWALGCFCSLIKYPNLSEGADHVGGQLRGDRVPLLWRNQIWQSLEEGAGKRCSECASVHGQLGGDKECPFSGVTNSGGVWRKVPENDVRSV